MNISWTLESSPYVRLLDAQSADYVVWSLIISRSNADATASCSVSSVMRCLGRYCQRIVLIWLPQSQIDIGIEHYHRHICSEQESV